MPKLSETFLHLLGNALQGDQGTPAALEQRGIRLSENQRAQAENARQNIALQTGLANSFNSVAPGMPTVNPQGSFQANPNDASLTGLVPGTTYQPIQRSATTPFITPGKTPGSAAVNYSSRPLGRGEVTEPAINTVSPYNALLLGGQKNILDQANSYRTAASNALSQMTNLTAKEDPGIMTSIMQGVMPDLASIKDKSVASAIPQLFQIYKQNKDQADQLSSQGIGMSPGGQPANRPSVNPLAGGNTRPPPPASLAQQLTTHPGTIPVWNRAANSYGLIPVANFNPMLHEQVQMGQNQ